MVRLKSRYILFELIYPVSENAVEERNSPIESRKNILLRHHQISPPEITTKLLVQEIRRSLQLNFGDYGLGKAASLLQIKYFSNMTSTGIIRCHREDCDLIIAALSLMTKVADINSIIINPIKVSGTIKKIEQYAIRRSQKILSVIQQGDGNMIDDFANVSEDDEQDDG